MKIRLCYRVEKEAGWGEDEHGNPTEGYSCVKLDCKTYNIPKQELNYFQEKYPLYIPPHKNYIARYAYFAVLRLHLSVCRHS